MPDRPRRYWMVQWSGGGGFGHYAWLLSDALAGDGHDVVLATRRTHELGGMPHRHVTRGLWADAPAGPRGPVRTVRIALARAWGWGRLIGAVLRRRGRGDIVHVQAGDRIGELPFMAALRWSGATLITTAHNVRPHDAGRLGRAKMRLLYRVPHGIVTHTREAGDQIRDIAGREVPVLVVRHPSYHPIADHFGTAPHPAPGTPPVVAHLGTVRPYKGFDRVVQAVAQARDAWPGLSLAVVGKPGADADVAGSLAGLPPDAVRAELGHVEIGRLVDAARAADVVMLGHRSASESGIAHLALGAGAVVVGPRVAAIGRLLEGEPGWTYAPEDPADGARVLGEVLAQIHADRPAMRARARAVAESVPSWQQAARATVAFADGLRRRPG